MNVRHYTVVGYLTTILRSISG